MNWPIAKMEDVFEIARGGSPRPIQDYFTESHDGINWILISDASSSSKYITTIKKKIKPSGVSKSRMVYPGDLLLTNSMSFGHPYIMNNTGCIHDGWLVLHKKIDNVNLDYFYYLLGSKFIYAAFKNKASGATVKNLNIDLVKKVQIPLPPLEDQVRIATVLTRAEQLIAKRKESIQALDALLKSTFLDMFGDYIVENGRNRIQDCLRLQQGYAFKSTDFVDTGIPVIKIGTVNKGFFDYSTLSFIDTKAVSNVDRFQIFPGDLLLSLTGTVGKDDYGNTCVVPRNGQYSKYLLNQRVAKLIPLEGIATEYFIDYFFKQPKIKSRLIKNNRGIRQANLSNSDIYDLALNIPPLSLQNQFAAIVEKVEALKGKYQLSLVELENLYGSLSQRAFKGELDLSGVRV